MAAERGCARADFIRRGVWCSMRQRSDTNPRSTPAGAEMDRISHQTRFIRRGIRAHARRCKSRRKQRAASLSLARGARCVPIAIPR